MKKLNLIILAGLLAALTQAPVFAQDDEAKAPVMDEKMAEAMKLTQPGREHQKLEPLIGKFKVKTTMWMGKDNPPSTTEGTSENKWILNGRFVQQNYKGEFMGRPFEGMGLIGYDNVAKEYNTVWIDSVGTGMMKSTAKYDDGQHALTEEGTFSCPMNGKKDNKYKSVTKFIDADHYTYEAWHDDPKTGENYKAMEIAYERE